MTGPARHMTTTEAIAEMVKGMRDAGVPGPYQLHVTPNIAAIFEADGVQLPPDVRLVVCQAPDPTSLPVHSGWAH